MHFFVMIKLNDYELQYFGNINNVCIFIHIFHLFCTKIIGWECSACISSPSLTPISPSLLIFIHRSSLTVFLSLLPLFFLLLSYCLSQWVFLCFIIYLSLSYLQRLSLSGPCQFTVESDISSQSKKLDVGNESKWALGLTVWV